MNPKFKKSESIYKKITNIAHNFKNIKEKWRLVWLKFITWISKPLIFQPKISFSGKNPFNDTINWKEDKCSKTLNGCTLRFGDLGTLPFGSFPGTVSYEYRLPG